MPPEKSPWRRVEARVHLSLAPQELANPLRAATRKAFSALLMRHSPTLGGVVVATIGPLKLAGPPVFVDASPYAHVRASAALLVFAPPRATELLGVVSHVGPDHLGMSVLSAFQAVIPIEGLTHAYRFEAADERRWTRIDGNDDDITVGRQIRFLVEAIKPTRSGLFQIIASLDSSLREKPNAPHPLGLLPKHEEIELSPPAVNDEPDDAVKPSTRVLTVGRRASLQRARVRASGEDLIAAGAGTFGDALAQTQTQTSQPVSALRSPTSKKRRRVESDTRTVSFDDGNRTNQVANGSPQRSSQKQPMSPSPGAGVVATQSPRTTGESTPASRTADVDPSHGGTANGDSSRKSSEKKKKKRRHSEDIAPTTERKKKKKKRKTRDEDEQGSAEPKRKKAKVRSETKSSEKKKKKHRHKGEDVDKTRVREDRRAGTENAESSLRERQNGKESRPEDATPREKSAERRKKGSKHRSEHGGDHSTERKRKKKRRRDDEGAKSEATLERSAAAGEATRLGTQVSEVATVRSQDKDVHRDHSTQKNAHDVRVGQNGPRSMYADALHAVNTPLQDSASAKARTNREAKLEDRDGLVLTQPPSLIERVKGLAEHASEDGKHKKKKKKKMRRESGEGEKRDSEKKKEKRKRMSEAVELNRRRSLGGSSIADVSAEVNNETTRRKSK